MKQRSVLLQALAALYDTQEGIGLTRLSHTLGLTL